MLKGRRLLPIVQGGMGVGISAHRLAGAVARLNAVGTISSVDLRRLHADLMAATGKSRDKDAIRQANLTALDRVPVRGSRFTAVPPRVEGFGTFPVRAFAELPVA